MTRLLIEEPPLQVLPSLAAEIGLNDAIVLQQLHYWSTRSDDGWVERPLKWWRGQFPFWGEATIKRTFARLREKGYVEQEDAGSFDRTNRYRPLYSGLPSGSKRSRRWDRSAPVQADPVSTERSSTSETSSADAEEEKVSGFDLWISHHAHVTGQRAPRVGSDRRRKIVAAFNARRKDWALDDLLVAIDGSWADDFLRDGGHCTPESILVPSKIARRIELGRKNGHVSADPRGGKYGYLVCN